jgi:20S proteasome subunit beta 4
MDFAVGIKGKDFAMLCSDTSAVQSIVTMKNDEEKLVPVDSHKLFAVTGEAGDRVHFCDLIVANVKFYELKNGQSLTTHAVAHYTRTQLADSRRSVCFKSEKFVLIASTSTSACV